MKFDDGLSGDERVENEALLQAQVDRMRWRAQMHDGDLARLTLRRALRRILCRHDHTGGAIDDQVCVRWCPDCGHSEVSMAPLAPDPEWFPEGKPAWSSAGDPPEALCICPRNRLGERIDTHHACPIHGGLTPARSKELSWPHLVIVYGLALFLLGLVVDLMR